MQHNVYNWQRFEHDVIEAPGAGDRLQRARRKSLRAYYVVVTVIASTVAIQSLIFLLFGMSA